MYICQYDFYLKNTRVEFESKSQMTHLRGDATTRLQRGHHLAELG